MDLRVVRIFNSVPVQSVTVLAGVSPTTADIRGSGFTYAEEVYINDIRCPSFAILDDSRILAEVPDLGLYEITNVAVWVYLLNKTGRNKLVPGLGASAATVTGMELLIQRFVKYLLSTPLTDAWGSEGGGLQAALRSPTDKQGSSITTSAAIAIATARDYLGSLDVPADQKLDTLEILNMQWNPDELGLYIDVVLTNVAGQTMQTTLGFGDG
jgi:hypothetical protein